MRIRTLSMVEVQYVAYRLAREMMEWGEAIPPFESRFPHALESCIATPFQKFGGKVLYPGLVRKGAILFYLLIKNHPFENGNKRIAMATLFLFLAKNKKWLNVDNIELYQFAKSIARSKPRSKYRALLKIRDFIERHLIPA